MPLVTAMLSSAAAESCTLRLPSDVAVAVSSRVPGSAKLTGLVVIETDLWLPGESVTWSVARLDTSAAGPPRLRSNVSCTVPVLYTSISNVLPGLPDDGSRYTLTPLATTVSVPEALLATELSVSDVAVTWKGKVPGEAPAAAVRVSVTSR